MTETLLSPSVITRENDQSQIIQGPKIAGAAIVGPTVKGPVNVPTLVTSYSDYINKFGGAFSLNNEETEYFTSISVYNYFQQGGDSVLVSRVVSGTFTPAYSIIPNSGSDAFELRTISYGEMMNSADNSGSLVSGSKDNIKWEILSPNQNTGTFTLLIRRGDDTDNQKVVLESWPNLSLDPKSPNFITSVIGNQYTVFNGSSIYDEGEYPTKSRYIIVSEVYSPTPDYIKSDGTPNSEYFDLLPKVGVGGFNGGEGELSSIEDIGSGSYQISLDLLTNKDEYQFDILTTPGKTTKSHSPITSLAMQVCIERGDAIYITDVNDIDDNIATAVSEAAEIDNSYSAAYYPWVKVNSPQTGKLLWIPPSTIIPSVYIYNDKTQGVFFAPAGFRRGGIPGVVQTRKKLSKSDRDILYSGKLNPIATFPGQGIVALGQRTLQTKETALKSVDVRRLLIDMKRYLSQVANNFLFEKNTTATRNSFLARVRPYLDGLQQRGGLYSYKLVMDDTNNTNEVIDRNQLVGQLWIQPTKTIEFIILDFNVTSTGVDFEQ